MALHLELSGTPSAYYLYSNPTLYLFIPLLPFLSDVHGVQSKHIHGGGTKIGSPSCRTAMQNKSGYAVPSGVDCSIGSRT